MKLLYAIKYATGKVEQHRRSAPQIQKLIASGKVIDARVVVTFTPEQQAHILAVKGLPCTVCGKAAPSEAHHCGTGMGRRKDHAKVIPVCQDCHISRPGGECLLSRREWEREYGTEDYHLQKTEIFLQRRVCP